MLVVLVLEALVALMVFAFYQIPEFRGMLKAGPEEVLTIAIRRYHDDEELRRWIDLIQTEVRFWRRPDASISIFLCLCGWCFSSFFHAVVYHWRELPQVSFLSRKVFVFVATKHVFCRDKSLLVETNLCCGKHTCLSRQKMILVAAPANDSPQLMMMMSWCLMSSDVIWHIRDKLWPMPKHGSIKSTYVRCMRV